MERGGGEWDCATVAKHLETLQFHLFPNRKTKCGRSLKEKGKPRAVLFSPFGGTAAAVAQYFQEFPLRLYLVPALYHGSRRECLVASEAQSER